MTITKGSSQGSGGKGLLITALTLGTAQTLHTAVAGVGTPQLFRLILNNTSNRGVQVTVVLEPSDASDPVTFVESVGAQQEKKLFGDVLGIPLNEAMVVKVYADTASAVVAYAMIADQASAPAVEQIHSGEVTLVQNDDAFRTNGVASSNVEADHQLLVPKDGVLQNLRVRAIGGIGGGATVTPVVRVNGGDTALTVSVAAAQGTNVVEDNTHTVAVSAGDLVTINFPTDNAGAPADTMVGAVEYQANA